MRLCEGVCVCVPHACTDTDLQNRISKHEEGREDGVGRRKAGAEEEEQRKMKGG